MNNYQLSSHRDKQIILALSVCKAMTTDQLTALLFPGKAGMRKCCQRLKYLRERELIQWVKRPFFDMPNVYYFGKDPALSAIPHIISVSWVYVWLSKRFEVVYWETEVTINDLRCDALCKIKSGQWFFIEFDRVASHNKFTKPIQYTELYEKEGKVGSTLLRRLDNPSSFPRIIVVTDNVQRGKTIKKAINENNPHSLGYGADKSRKDEIYLFSEILKEVKQCK